MLQKAQHLNSTFFLMPTSEQVVEKPLWVYTI